MARREEDKGDQHVGFEYSQGKGPWQQRMGMGTCQGCCALNCEIESVKLVHDKGWKPSQQLKGTGL